SNYYRDLAIYEFVKRLYRPVRLVIKNAGRAPADNVRLEMVVPRNEGIVIMDTGDVPEPPERHKDIMISPRIPALLRHGGEVTIDKHDDRFRVEIDRGSLQPGRRVWS